MNEDPLELPLGEDAIEALERLAEVEIDPSTFPAGASELYVDRLYEFLVALGADAAEVIDQDAPVRKTLEALAIVFGAGDDAYHCQAILWMIEWMAWKLASSN